MFPLKAETNLNNTHIITFRCIEYTMKQHLNHHQPFTAEAEGKCFIFVVIRVHLLVSAFDSQVVSGCACKTLELLIL